MVAPAFGRIAEEANAAVEGERERLGSSSGVWGTGEYDADPSIEYYETMSAVRQSILNLLAVGLHHLFEQQQLFFLRKELVRGDGGKLKAEAIERHLTECGVNYQRLTSTARLDELRLAANAIKHGDGRSARELAPLRPDLFEYSVQVVNRRRRTLSHRRGRRRSCLQSLRHSPATTSTSLNSICPSGATRRRRTGTSLRRSSTARHNLRGETPSAPPWCAGAPSRSPA